MANALTAGYVLRMARHSRSGVHRVFGACVLLVEDNTDNAELYAIWLRSAGHRVSIVSDAARALILAPVLRPTVAVIDIGSSEIDGLRLVKLLRDLPELSACQYIAVTAYADARLPGRCQAAGFAALLEKPTPRAALVERVLAAAVWSDRGRYRKGQLS